MDVSWPQAGVDCRARNGKSGVTAESRHNEPDTCVMDLPLSPTERDGLRESQVAPSSRAEVCDMIFWLA